LFICIHRLLSISENLWFLDIYLKEIMIREMRLAILSKYLH
jgi:hypothetical protein